MATHLVVGRLGFFLFEGTTVRALISKVFKPKRRRDYTHIVSLGSSCRPSYQIARHFKFKESYPFDGWITPLDSIALYIERLGEDLYEPANLQEWRKDGEILTIVNVKFQIELFHDFKRGGTADPPNVLPNWQSGIEQARSRTDHLVDKFQSLNRSSNHILFVRHLDKVSNQPLFGTRLNKRQATEQLLGALRTRFDRISFDLMCVSFTRRWATRDPSVIYVDMSDPSPEWEGPTPSGAEPSIRSAAWTRREYPRHRRVSHKRPDIAGTLALTSRGSLVRSQSRPPFLLRLCGNPFSGAWRDDAPRLIR